MRAPEPCVPGGRGQCSRTDGHPGRTHGHPGRTHGHCSSSSSRARLVFKVLGISVPPFRNRPVSQQQQLRCAFANKPSDACFFSPSLSRQAEVSLCNSFSPAKRYFQKQCPGMENDSKHQQEPNVEEFLFMEKGSELPHPLRGRAQSAAKQQSRALRAPACKLGDAGGKQLGFLAWEKHPGGCRKHFLAAVLMLSDGWVQDPAAKGAAQPLARLKVSRLWQQPSRKATDIFDLKPYNNNTSNHKTRASGARQRSAALPSLTGIFFPFLRTPGAAEPRPQAHAPAPHAFPSRAIRLAGRKGHGALIGAHIPLLIWQGWLPEVCSINIFCSRWQTGSS